MKQYVQTACLTCFAILFFFSPGQGWAVPREVTLFPASAQVLESAKLKVASEGNLKKALFTLPAQADPDSLVTRLNQAGKFQIMDQTWRQILRQDDERIWEVRKKIETTKNERNAMQASIRALEAQIQFWQLQTKAKVKTITDAGNLAAAISKNIRKAYQDKLSQEPELEKLEKKINELQEELNRRVGKKDNIWEVTLLLSGAPPSGDVSITYTYALSGCGWSPLYRLEARPREKQVLFTWEAEIWQSSGQDWSQVAMNLATLQPTSSIAPKDLPPWIIQPRQPIVRKNARGKAAKAEALMASAEITDQVEEAPAAVPREVRQSTYAVWQLGKMTLPAGVRQRVKVQEEPWAAEFSYLVRPGLSSKAFVRAAIDFPEAREIPSGQAIFMLDGAILGKRPFAFAGKERILFFGEDPLVSAKVDLLSKQSGEKTFLADRQTYHWQWRTDIENRRNDAVRVRVEESLPQSRDTRIKLTVKNAPEPAEQNASTWSWFMDVPAGQKKSILTTISLEAPKEMIIDLGWKR